MTEKEDTGEDWHGNARISSATGFFFNDFGGGLQVNWSSEDGFFGDFIMSFDKERGKMQISADGLTPNFVAKVMEKLVYNSVCADETEKVIVSVSLEETDKTFPFRKNVLHLPFYEGEDKSNPDLYEMRWRLPEEKILNVWFNKKIIEESYDDPFLVASTICDNKSFANGFAKAEIWSWVVKAKI